MLQAHIAEGYLLQFGVLLDFVLRPGGVFHLTEGYLLLGGHYMRDLLESTLLLAGFPCPVCRLFVDFADFMLHAHASVMLLYLSS